MIDFSRLFRSLAAGNGMFEEFQTMGKMTRVLYTWSEMGGSDHKRAQMLPNLLLRLAGVEKTRRACTLFAVQDVYSESTAVEAMR